MIERTSVGLEGRYIVEGMLETQPIGRSIRVTGMHTCTHQQLLLASFSMTSPGKRKVRDRSPKEPPRV